MGSSANILEANAAFVFMVELCSGAECVCVRACEGFLETALLRAVECTREPSATCVLSDHPSKYSPDVKFFLTFYGAESDWEITVGQG